MKIFLILLSFLSLASFVFAGEDVDLAVECSPEVKLKTLIRKKIMTKQLCIDIVDSTEAKKKAGTMFTKGIKLVITGQHYTLGDHLNKNKYNYECPAPNTGNIGIKKNEVIAKPEEFVSKFENFPLFLKRLKAHLKAEQKDDKITGQVIGYADGVRYIGPSFDGYIEKIVSAGDKEAFSKFHCSDMSDPDEEQVIGKENLRMITSYRNKYLALSRAETLDSILKVALGSSVTFLPPRGRTSGKPGMITLDADDLKMEQEEKKEDDLSIESGLRGTGCCPGRRGAVAYFDIPTLEDKVDVKSIYMTPVFNAAEEPLAKKMHKTAAATFVNDFKSYINSSSDTELKTLVSTATTITQEISEDKLVQAGIPKTSASKTYYTKIKHNSNLNTEKIYSKTITLVNSFISSKWGITPTKNYEKNIANYMAFLFWACFKGSCTFTPDQEDMHALGADNDKNEILDLKAISAKDIINAVIAENKSATGEVIPGKYVSLSEYLKTTELFNKDNRGINRDEHNPFASFIKLHYISQKLSSNSYNSNLKLVSPSDNVDIKKEINDYRTKIMAILTTTNKSHFSKLTQPTATKVANFMISFLLRKKNIRYALDEQSVTYDTYLLSNGGKIYLIEHNIPKYKYNIAQAIKTLDSTAPAYGSDAATTTNYVTPANAKQSGPSQGTEIFSFLDLRDAYADMLNDTNKANPLFRNMAQPVKTKYVTGVKMESSKLAWIENPQHSYKGKGYFHTACGSGTKLSPKDKKFLYKSWWDAINDAEDSYYYTIPSKATAFNMIKLKHLHAYLINGCQDCSCLWGKTGNEIAEKLKTATALDFSGYKDGLYTVASTAPTDKTDATLILGTNIQYNTTMCLFSPIVPLAHYAGEGGQTFTPTTIVPPKANCGIIAAANEAVKNDVITSEAEINAIYNYCNAKLSIYHNFPWSRTKCEKDLKSSTQCSETVSF